MGSKIFSSYIGVKQGCPLSPTLFGLCIDQLEHMVLEYAHQEGIEDVAIGNVAIMLLLYVDDVVLLAPTPQDAQKLMWLYLKYFAHTAG